MKNTLFVCVTLLVWLLAFDHMASAQWLDPFEDDDLTTAPEWIGQLDDFQQTADDRLQLMASAAGSSQLLSPIAPTDSFAWHIDYELTFAPSSSNTLQWWIAAQDADLDQSLGLWVNIGINGSADSLQIWQRTDQSTTLVAAGQAGFVADAHRINLDISYNNGQWVARASRMDGARDSVQWHSPVIWSSANWYSGFRCTYTSSRVDDFYLDEIGADTLRPDNQAPKIVEVLSLAENELLIRTIRVWRGSAPAPGRSPS